MVVLNGYASLWPIKSKKTTFLAATPGLEYMHYKYGLEQEAAKFLEITKKLARHAVVTFKQYAAIGEKVTEEIKSPVYREPASTNEPTNKVQ